METFIHQVVAGIATGGVYASLALALVMIYQSTHHINFAQGEIAMFATYMAWTLINAGVSIVVVFIGLLVILNSIAGWIFTYTIKAFPSPFPKEPPFGLYFISSHELGSIGVTMVLLLLLYSFFKFTPLGLAMRAAAQNPDSSRLVGIRVGWMLALGWGLAAAIGSVAGMMIAPVVFLEPNMMSGVLLYAFAAALVGGIDSPGGAVLGGFIVGILENILGAYVIGTELKLSVALVLIIVVLTIKPAGLFGKVIVSRV
jgi:branched-chain amino acid transport system permease protein